MKRGFKKGLGVVFVTFVTVSVAVSAAQENITRKRISQSQKNEDLLQSSSSDEFVWAPQITQLPDSRSVVDNAQDAFLFKRALEDGGGFSLAWIGYDHKLYTAGIDSNGGLNTPESLEFPKAVVDDFNPEDVFSPEVVTYIGKTPVYFLCSRKYKSSTGENKVTGFYYYNGSITSSGIGLSEDSNPYYGKDKVAKTIIPARCICVGKKLLIVGSCGTGYTYGLTGVSPFATPESTESFPNTWLWKLVACGDTVCALARYKFNDYSDNYHMYYRDSSKAWQVFATYDGWRKWWVDIAAFGDKLYIASTPDERKITLDKYTVRDNGVTKEKSWTYEVDSQIGSVRVVSISVDTNGTPYIGCLMWNNYKHDIRLLKLDTGNENLVKLDSAVVTGLPATPGVWVNQYQFIHLAFNAHNDPVILFYHYEPTYLGYISGSRKDSKLQK